MTQTLQAKVAGRTLSTRPLSGALLAYGTAIALYYEM